MRLSCKNHYTIRKVNADGVETEVARFHNVPLQVFYTALIGANYGYSVNQTVHSCWFGTGSTPPSESDKGLTKALWTYSWNYSNVVSWEKYLNEERHICHRYTFKIAADQDHVGIVSEVGVAFATSRGGSVSLATHALILDAEGNPMTIEKTDLEVLFVDVIFEISSEDSEHFKWLPENYVNYGASSGSGWAPIFNLGLFERVHFLGRVSDDGFNVRLASISIGKSYANNYHELITTGGRLPQNTIPSQRYIKGIGIGTSNGTLLGYWKLLNPEIIPPKKLEGMVVGTGDGTTKAFNAPLAEWVKDSEEIYVNEVLQVRGVDYVCSHDANFQGLSECSLLQEMEYIGEYTTAPQNIITPILGYGPYANGGYKAALWNTANPTLTFAFPEKGIRAIKRFKMKNFTVYSSMTSDSSSSSTNWSGAMWTIEHSEDGQEWTKTGEYTVVSNAAEAVFESPISARYWRFTIAGVRGNYFAANSVDSITAYSEALPITFTEAPPEGAVIKMNATVDCPMKNSNFILDVNPTFEV